MLSDLLDRQAIIDFLCVSYGTDPRIWKAMSQPSLDAAYLTARAWWDE